MLKHGRRNEIMRTFAIVMADKHLYIISGPNGAGKTTASMTLLPEVWQCREFVNADAIAEVSDVIRNVELYQIIKGYVE